MTLLILCILMRTIWPSYLVRCEEYTKEEFVYMDAVAHHELAAQRLYYRMTAELFGAPQTKNQIENSQAAEFKANKTMEKLKNLVIKMDELSACAHALDQEVSLLKTVYLKEEALMRIMPLTSNMLLGVTSTADMNYNASNYLKDGSIFGTKDGVYTVSLPSLTKTKISNDYGRQVAFDRSSRKVYWINPEAKSIKRANLDGTEVEIVLQVDSKALAVDSITGNVYYQNATSDDIRVCSRSGEKCSVLATNQIFVDNIVVHPSKSFIFWIRDVSTVVRANMDGTNQEVILSNKVYSFAVDEDSDRIYWIALDRQTVHSCDLAGLDERVLLNPTGFHSSAMFFNGGGAHLDRYISQGFKSINKHALNPIIIANATDFIVHMAVYGRERYSRSNPCASSPCSHLCVLKLESFACLCPQGKPLHQDGTTCL